MKETLQPGDEREVITVVFGPDFNSLLVERSELIAEQQMDRVLQAKGRRRLDGTIRFDWSTEQYVGIDAGAPEQGEQEVQVHFLRVSCVTRAEVGESSLMSNDIPNPTADGDE